MCPYCYARRRFKSSSVVAVIRVVTWGAVSQASPWCQRLPPASRPTEDSSCPGDLSGNITDIDIDIDIQICATNSNTINISEI
ncbi:hypothetical protein PF005_g29710 [Phytophthora fragariae]|uniref:Uncharacterized protein n=1 Tax=Phytophthora fragariae TaxID=53985 RepID=A0A6A4B8X8_9STRA|nr:hypothetical protein PF003_g23607 [Phytophthora fragariae]KAE8919636.1 hypothetical protein PF009_g30061 [Phytophthora fragariae]KAE8964116.1 hypothetical protein PF011_g28786 [Phytophthora fragariae]KAE9062577.1 hypothetical protein PF010_g29342 [Phytophthora fragariae]KAE9063523.1 hypothetical protein PF007_g29522 [Phytophthora fragariae]